jgi:hypothetical protein
MYFSTCHTLNEVTKALGVQFATRGRNILGTSCRLILSAPSEDWILCSGYNEQKYHKV